MASPLTRRITSLVGSATVQVANQVHELRRQGIDVVDLGDGDPDFDTPEHIRRAGIESMQSGFTHYVPSAGIPELRKAIAEKLAAENGVQVDPDQGVLVTPGAKLALYASILALVEDGQEVILPEPAWVSYRPVIQLAGGITVPLKLEARNGFAMTEESLSALVTPRTRVLILNSPSNPTGRVFTRTELEIVAAVATTNDLYVLSDEIYEKIVFDDHRHLSIGSLPGMAKRTLTINGMSKSYAMTGWRLGYLAGPVELVREIGKIQGHTVTCAPSFVQAAGVAALRGPQEAVARMAAEYRRRRDFFVEMLNDIPGVRCLVPQGTFYAFPRLDLGMDSVRLAGLLLERARVAATPGSAFGESGDGHVRLSFAVPPGELERAAMRIRRALG